MGGGRKNMKRASKVEEVALQDGQSIMQVLSLRGSNLIEIMDANGGKHLALFPAKFQRSIWIKRGSFVVVDGSGMEKALESGSKISCMVSQVLFHEQVRALKKSSEWPEIFKTTLVDDSNVEKQSPIVESNDDSDSIEDDGIPPLEANLNRIRPMELYSDSETDGD